MPGRDERSLRSVLPLPARTAAWATALATAGLACLVLGRGPAVGAGPVRMALAHVTLLVLLWPLIRWFPFPRRGTPVILLLAVGARVAMLPLLPSDDVHRYVWEGRVLAAGANPYLLAPDAPELEALRDEHWDRINHKDMATIYPPGMLLLFRGLARVTDSPRGFKYVLTAVDLLNVYLLLLVLRAFRRKEAWALLYALNPVILLSHAGEAHLDVFFALFSILALLALARERWVAMFLALALAVQVKYVAVLFLPFVLTRVNWKSAWAFAAASLLCFLPFWPGTGMFTTLVTFSRDMHYNGSLHALLGWGLDDYALASTLCAAALACAVMTVRAATPRLLEGGLFAMMLLLLFSPNVHFWYLGWFIPFLCFVPYPPLLVLCGTIAFTYATLGQYYATGVWREVAWAPWAVYLPVFAAVAVGVLRRPRPHRFADARRLPAPGPVSVVLPVLNEAERLPGLLRDIAAQGPAVGEVIVADAGSVDDTVRVARAGGAEVVQALPGRGRQIAAALEAAKGRAVAVVHADMRLPPGVMTRVMEALSASDRAGGCVGSRFTGATRFLRGIDLVNAWRARFFGLAFGDQCQFFRRDLLDEAGGFPPLPLMEDVELSLRLRSLGPPLYLGERVEVEPRRWARTSRPAHACLVVRLVATYVLRRLRYGPETRTDDLYERYYAPLREGENTPRRRPRIRFGQ